ncbi:MAG: hypothetical protein HND27_05620 [Bacteroidetes bacterium]|nr:hypothetical protein [Bacteroidota bacterium]MBV6462273.1 hypothetical protein [Flavobacteriales bacterium]WKZ74857.1 MAG: hypothetical protein QY303_12005 [Vicingaceae bacterium]MCL4816079.1 hypothetical protein [Flavobacteriales bacterium]NOG95238.1 hypothetical protein [Bacteroidota bacterium]
MNNRYYKKLALTIALFLTLVGIAGIVKKNEPSSEIFRKHFWTYKVHSSKKYNIIFEGDSRIYRGIDVNSFNKGININSIHTLNFGFSSGGHNKDIFNAVENKLLHTSLNIVVLGITPFSLTPKAQLNEHFIEEQNRNKGETIERMYFYPFLSFFEPFNIQKLLHPDTVTYYEKFHKNGWVESYKIPANPNEALTSYKKEFENNQVSDTVIAVLLQKVKEWKNKHIKVYAFRPPTTVNMETLENNISGFNEKEFIKKFETVGGKWIEIENRFNYNSYDGSHLHFYSAQQLSYYLGEKIKADVVPK